MKGLLAVACLVIVYGCSGSSHVKDVKDTPEFGSTPKLNTTEGFVVGKWRYEVDTSTARSDSGSKAGGLLNALSSKELEIREDGKFHIWVGDHEGDGTWKVGVDGIDLQLEQLDGKPVGIVRDQMTSEQRLADVRHLSLASDKRQLLEVVPVREDGTTFAGTPSWIRE